MTVLNEIKPPDADGLAFLLLRSAFLSVATDTNVSASARRGTMHAARNAVGAMLSQIMEEHPGQVPPAMAEEAVTIVREILHEVDARAEPGVWDLSAYLSRGEVDAASTGAPALGAD